MKKLLDSFTDERLKELSVEEDLYNYPPTQEELNSLARIALAVKMAEPEWYFVITSVGVWQARYKTRHEAENHIKPWNHGYWIKEIYTTPQLNSPEIPKGWKLVPIEPTDAMQVAAAQAIRFDTTNINKLWTGKRVYADMLAAAPESNHD
ncbi:hypothetical protein [Yersinia aldovae]|uniref:hypothetical protein n=1 Tax=Yersinia aldovae TaxID=29483 RepID=UPI00119D4FA1|nr:hypothetical protein [Yersinia aldovae]